MLFCYKFGYRVFYIVSRNILLFVNITSAMKKHQALAGHYFWTTRKNYK